MTPQEVAHRLIECSRTVLMTNVYKDSAIVEVTLHTYEMDFFRGHFTPYELSFTYNTVDLIIRTDKLELIVQVVEAHDVMLRIGRNGT